MGRKRKKKEKKEKYYIGPLNESGEDHWWIRDCFYILLPQPKDADFNIYLPRYGRFFYLFLISWLTHVEGFLKEQSFELVWKEILQTHFIIFYYILILAKFQGDKKSVAISYIKCLISSFYIFKLCIKNTFM